jgi:hypothetical protein
VPASGSDAERNAGPAKRRASPRAGGKAGTGEAGASRGASGTTGAEVFDVRPEDAMAFMQRMWNPFGVALPGFAAPATGENPGLAALASMMQGGAAAASSPPAASRAAPMSPFAPPLPFPNPAAMFLTLDPAEVERKIAELRVIEGWLRTVLGMMEMSIRTLELQQASLEALRAAAGVDGSGGG